MFELVCTIDQWPCTHDRAQGVVYGQTYNISCALAMHLLLGSSWFAVLIEHTIFLVHYHTNYA